MWRGAGELRGIHHHQHSVIIMPCRVRKTRFSLTHKCHAITPAQNHDYEHDGHYQQKQLQLPKTSSLRRLPAHPLLQPPPSSLPPPPPPPFHPRLALGRPRPAGAQRSTAPYQSHPEWGQICHPHHGGRELSVCGRANRYGRRMGRGRCGRRGCGGGVGMEARKGGRLIMIVGSAVVSHFHIHHFRTQAPICSRSCRPSTTSARYVPFYVSGGWVSRPFPTLPFPPSFVTHPVRLLILSSSYTYTHLTFIPNRSRSASAPRSRRRPAKCYASSTSTLVRALLNV